MSMDFLQEVYNAYGFWGLGAFLGGTVVFAITIRILVNTFSDKNILRWFKKEKYKREYLLENLFFTNTRFKLDHEIPHMDMGVGSPILQQAFRDILYMHVETMYYGIKNIVKAPFLNKISPGEWERIIKRELTSIRDQYETKAENFGIPRRVVNSYIDWASGYTTLLCQYLNQLSSNNSYADNIMRTEAFLFILNIFIISLIGDSKHIPVDQSLNGLEYRGNLIEV